MTGRGLRPVRARHRTGPSAQPK